MTDGIPARETFSAIEVPLLGMEITFEFRTALRTAIDRIVDETDHVRPAMAVMR
jgi:hypothetical protein